MTSKAIEQFGKLFIENVRDRAIVSCNMRVQMARDGRETKSAQRFKEFVQSLNEAQLASLRQMIPWFVDDTLHDLLFMFEEYDWIRIVVETEEETLSNIRDAASGLQGYLFEWAEKYSKQPLTTELFKPK